MDDGPGNRIQNSHDGKRDRHQIDRHRQYDIEPDRPDRDIRQFFQVRYFRQIVAHQGNIGCLDCNIASHASHRDTDIGHFQGRRVVDAIAYHADDTIIPLHLPDGIHFLHWQKPCANLFNTCHTGKITCCPDMVACQQKDIGSHPAKSACHVFRGRPERVGQSDQADTFLPARDQNDRLSFRKELVHDRKPVPVHHDIEIGKVRDITAHDIRLIDTRTDTFSRNHREPVRTGKNDFFFPGIIDNRLSERMFRTHLGENRSYRRAEKKE
jgi:hypothetical protein